MNQPKATQVCEPAWHYTAQNVWSASSWHDESSLVLREASLAAVGHQVEIWHEVANVQKRDAKGVGQIRPLEEQGQLQVGGDSVQQGSTWWSALWICLGKERKEMLSFTSQFFHDKSISLSIQLQPALRQYAELMQHEWLNDLKAILCKVFLKGENILFRLFLKFS